MTKKGLLIVISGFSGAGKGTLVKELMSRYDTFALSVSATTRAPRAGEEDGVHYFFKDRAGFEKMIAEGAFYEYATYQGNYYGTPRRYVDEQLAAGRDVILEIEVQGAEKIRRKFPDTVCIFVTAPSAAELKERLLGRGTESREKVLGRLKRAEEEISYIGDYQYLLVNDDPEAACRRIREIVESERQQVKYADGMVAQFQSELKQVVSEFEV